MPKYWFVSPFSPLNFLAIPLNFSLFMVAKIPDCAGKRKDTVRRTLLPKRAVVEAKVEGEEPEKPYICKCGNSWWDAKKYETCPVYGSKVVLPARKTAN